MKNEHQNCQKPTASLKKSEQPVRLSPSFGVGNNASVVQNCTIKTDQTTFKDRAEGRPISISDRYRAPNLRNGRYWIQRNIYGVTKPGINGIPTVTTTTTTQNTATNNNNNSRSNLELGSSSKGSLICSRISSKNFIQDNIDRVKSSKGLHTNSKMPTGGKPPLPKSGSSKPQVGSKKLLKRLHAFKLFIIQSKRSRKSRLCLQSQGKLR